MKNIKEIEYEIYLGDDTNDITNHSLNNMEEWQGENGDAWNNE